MQQAFARLSDRGRIQLAANLAFALSWAVTALRFSGGQVLLHGLLVAGFLLAAVVACREGRLREEPSAAAEPVARAAQADPLEAVSRHGVLLSLAGTLVFDFGYLLAVSTPKAHGANFGAAGLMLVSVIVALTGLTKTLQGLFAVKSTESPDK